jgi:phosphoenolpyruvate carboxykinase (ATP)
VSLVEAQATATDAYDAMAKNLAAQFVKNFEKYASGANAEILAAAPKV